MKEENYDKDVSPDLDLHVILTFFDEKIGPTPYLVYPRPHLELNLKKISNLMFQEEVGFFIHSNPSIGTANYYFELLSPLARGKKEMIMISFIYNPIFYDPEHFQVLLEQFVMDLKQNKEIFYAFHKEEVSFENFQVNYEKLRQKIHLLYNEGLELVSEKVIPY